MQSLEKKLTGKWCTPLLYFIKELLVSDLGLELYVLTVMPMRYAQISGTYFFVFVRGLVYFNIACTSRCAPVWDADISRINMKKKTCKTLHRCKRCRTDTSFPGRFGTARICMPVHMKNKLEFVMVGFIVILYHALLFM